MAPKPMLPSDEGTINEPAPGSMKNDHPQLAKLQLSPMSIIGDVMVLLTPLLFVALAIAAAMLNGKHQSPSGDAVQNALLLSPTIFPIVFAAVLGRCSQSIALYMSQKGIQMKLLEHLSGSQSLFSSLKRLFALRNFGIAGLAITSFWLLSPVGGQGLLRLLSLQNSEEETGLSASFLNRNVVDPMGPLSGASSGGSTVSLVSAAYLSSLLTPESVQRSPRDQWGNPKVPARNSLDRELIEDGGWVAIESNPDPPTYMSLVGIPVALDCGGNCSFVMKTLHLEFSECSTNISNTTMMQAFDGSILQWGNLSLTTYSMLTGSPSSFFHASQASWDAFTEDPLSSHVDVYYGSRTNTPSGETDWPAMPYSFTHCSMAPMNLDVNVTCTNDECAVSAVRYGSRDGLSNATWDGLRGVFRDAAWIGMGAAVHPNQASLTDCFLDDPFSTLNCGYGYVDLWKLDPDVITERLTLAFNAFYYSQATQSFALGSSFAADSQALVDNAPATETRDTGQIYKCNQSWLGVVLAISIILELAALLSIVLKWMTAVPDIFGYVSSLTMDNEYCIHAGVVESSALDGLTRARKLGHMLFRVADVNASRDVGHFSFLPAGEGSEEIQVKPRALNRVDRGRYYS